MKTPKELILEKIEAELSLLTTSTGEDEYENNIQQGQDIALSMMSDWIADNVPDGWESMDSAPKDGTRILGWDESNRGYPAECEVVWWVGRHGEDWRGIGDCDPHPTKWRPLPPPPTE